MIVRTAAEGASEEEHPRREPAQGSVGGHREEGEGRQRAESLYGEPDLTVRIVRDLFTEDFGELIIEGNGG